MRRPEPSNDPKCNMTIVIPSEETIDLGPRTIHLLAEVLTASSHAIEPAPTIKKLEITDIRNNFVLKDK